MSYLGRRVQPTSGRRGRTPEQQRRDRERAKANYVSKPTRKHIALELHRSKMLAPDGPLWKNPRIQDALADAVREFDAWERAPRGHTHNRKKKS